MNPRLKKIKNFLSGDADLGGDASGQETCREMRHLIRRRDVMFHVPVIIDGCVKS